MYTLSCRDLGMNCDFVARDETIEGVIMKLYGHGSVYHPKALEDIMEKARYIGQDGVMAMIIPKIRQE